jgi:hypothetical protein
VHSLLLIVTQKHTTLCGQVASGVISTAGLTKFNFIPKAFSSKYRKHFAFAKSNKTLNVNPKSPCFCRPLAFSQLKVKTQKHHYLGSLSGFQ